VLMLVRERDEVAVAQHVSIMPVPSLRDSGVLGQLTRR